MLVEFSVKNFKSFKEKQTLSMVAAKKDKTLPQNLIPVDIPGLRNTNLLKSAVIYGANASGKSNLIKAFDYFVHFVLMESLEAKIGTPIKISPFVLDDESINEPSEFEILFIFDNVLHQYGFSITKNLVLEEWLLVSTSNKPATFFHRLYDEKLDKYEWKFSSYLKGDKVSLSENTRAKSLYLSTAAQLNHKQLSPIFEWLNKSIRVMDTMFVDFYMSFTAELLTEEKELRNIILNLIQKADLGIGGMECVPDFKDEKDIPIDLSTQTKLDIIEKWNKNPGLKIKMIHSSKYGNDNTFEPEDESNGTIKYFSMLGPLLDGINSGRILFIDEFDSSIHPNLLKALIENIHHNKKVNKTGFQLIVTTHDSSLIDSHLFRRDQIWFTEKNNNGESILYPLTDYKPRNDESLEKGYLAGRYGAIPIISANFSLE